MSKQINYYMDKETEILFIRYIRDNGFIFLKFADGAKVNPNNDCGLIFLVTKERYHSLIEYKNKSVNVLKSLVIEYSRNNIIEDKRIVTKGRIYISDAYKEPQFASYRDSLISDYNLLYKWIKKNVPFQTYNNMGKIQKEYISDGMLSYSEANYHFQA